MITRTTIGLDGEEIINIDTVSTIKVFEIEITDLQAEVAQLKELPSELLGRIEALEGEIGGMIEQLRKEIIDMKVIINLQSERINELTQ